MSTERVSPTAYMTGHFWYLNGLSHRGLTTTQGRVLHWMFRPAIVGTRLLSGMSLDALLLARHRGIDARLTAAIEDGRVQQIIEIAAGLSPRGWRFKHRFGDRIRYIETDLPHMARTKQQQLQRSGLQRTGHEIQELDALADAGPNSLQALTQSLNPKLGTAIVTEGLMNYFAPDDARRVWRNIANTLQRFPCGLYLSDLYLQRDHQGSRSADAFRALLGKFVRGRIHVHFDTERTATEALRPLGFEQVLIHRTQNLPATRHLSHIRGADTVSVLEAVTAGGAATK